MRFGMCCIFLTAPIKFRTATAKNIGKLDEKSGLTKLAEICHSNAKSLNSAITFCADNGIGAFRVNSQIWPLKTHPYAGYKLSDLPNSDSIINSFKMCRILARKHDIRLSFHPDQFVVLNSLRPEVVENSILELEYQAEVADLIGADVINIHAGGVYGCKKEALKRLVINLNRLSDSAREKITLENDYRCYTPSDLLPVCQSESVPLVYDVHHHRCLQDEISIDSASEAALKTWIREPLFHISSPKDGWEGTKTYRHHDYIDIKDFPDLWRDLDITIEVEAKAKEIAVLKLMEDLENQSIPQ